MSGKTFLQLVSLGLLAASAHAQDPAKADAPPLDLEARKASVITLRQHIDQREQRLTEISNDILALDKRLETRIDGIVKTLSEIKDSNESRTKVARSKEEAVAALKKTIDAYVSKRADIREQLRTSDSPSDQTALAGDVKKLDSRISKRVDQIAELTKSLTPHEELKKYESTGGGGFWNGVYYDNSRVSEDWKQNRRETPYTEAQLKDLTGALRESIENLKRREADVRTKLAANPGGAQKNLLQLEQGEVTSLIDRRDKQLAEVATPSQPDTKPIGQEEAYHLDGLLEDARRDLADDFNTILRRYSELVRERTHVKELEDNLKAREKWLADKGVTVPAATR